MDIKVSIEFKDTVTNGRAHTHIEKIDLSYSCGHKKDDQLTIVSGICDAVEYEVPVEITVERCGKTIKQAGTATHTQIDQSCSCVDITKKCSNGIKHCDESNSWKHCGKNGFLVGDALSQRLRNRLRRPVSPSIE